MKWVSMDILFLLADRIPSNSYENISKNFHVVYISDFVSNNYWRELGTAAAIG